MNRTSEANGAATKADESLPPGPAGAAFGWGSTLVVAAVAALFLLLSYVPLRATDLWGHVLYGEWILDHGELPREDPFLPLAAGMEVVDADWLSQLALAATHRAAGGEGLSLLFAALVSLTFALHARSLWLLAGSRRGVAFGVAGLLLVGWSRLFTIRPENFAALGLALVVWLLVRSGAYRSAGAEIGAPEPRVGRSVWIGVPLLAALWANLHGSFPVVVLVLSCLALGRGAEVGRATRSVGAVFADRSFRRLVLLAEAALVATLANPYGFDLWLRVATFSSNPNLADIVEWQPLVILGPGGREFGLSVVVLLFLMRLGRRRLWIAEGLLLAVFGGLSIFGVRMLTWYAPVFALVVGRHFARGVEGGAARAAGLPQRFSPRLRMAVAALAVWVAFALSPAGGTLLGGAGRSPAQLYGPETPLDLTLYLRSRRPAGITLAPQWWADWLVRQGPPGFQPMVGSNIHLVPPRVWGDYMRAQRSGAGWMRVLDRYRIDTVVLDRALQESQIAQLRRAEEWEAAHQDTAAAVFVRRPARASESGGGADG